MSKFVRLFFVPVTLLISLVLVGCGSDSSAPVGILNISVVDGSSSPATGINGAHVIILDGTGEPVTTSTSNSSGTVASLGLLPDSYQVRVSAQGYTSSPALGAAPLPAQVVLGQTTDITITLFPLADAALRGTVTGSVLNTVNAPVGGALIIGTTGASSVATISALDGTYTLNNVLEGSAEIKAFASGLNFPALSSVSVTAGATASGQNLVANSVANASLTGSLSFVAGGTAQTTDVTLVDRASGEVIPGMQVFTDASNNYVLSGIPNGAYEIIASLENDGNVMDPDESVTQGPAYLDVAAGVATPATKDFKITGAIALDTPAVPGDGEALPVLSATPTFEWHQTSSYSSYQEYVVELVNESGDTVWGGYDGSDLPVVTVPKTDPVSLDYTGPALESGRYYQLRLIATDVSNAVKNDPGTMLSTTENLAGTFKVE